MTTIDQAREAIYQRWVTQWASTTAYLFDNEQDGGLSLGTASWARLSVRELGGGQETLGESGNRKYRRRLSAFVQIFTLVNTGIKTAGTLAQQVRGIFEGVSFSELDFDNSSIRELGPDGRWLQTLVEISFAYEEVK